MSAPVEAKTAGLAFYMRYRDVAGAVEWLSSTLGFERHTVLTGPDGEILHAELKFGRGIVMLGPVRDSDFDRLFRQPDEIGGHETQSCYLSCEDADAICLRAKAAGAEIMLEVQDDEAGRRGFTCRDPQGHIWSIGTYDPWRTAPMLDTAANTIEPRFRSWHGGERHIGSPALLATFAGTLGALVMLVFYASHSAVSTVDGVLTAPAFESSKTSAAAIREAVETGALPGGTDAAAADQQEAAQTLNAVRAALASERTARIAAEQAAEKIRVDLARATETSRVAMDALRAEGARAERARAAAEDTLRSTRDELATVHKARETAERSAAAAESGLNAERKQRASAEAELEEAMKTISGKPQPRTAKEAALAPADAAAKEATAPDAPASVAAPAATSPEKAVESETGSKEKSESRRSRTKPSVRAQSKPSVAKPKKKIDNGDVPAPLALP